MSKNRPQCSNTYHGAWAAGEESSKGTITTGKVGELRLPPEKAGTIRYVTNKPSVKGFKSQFDIEVGTTQGGK